MNPEKRSIGLWIRMLAVSLLMMVLFIGAAMVLSHFVGYFWAFSSIAILISAVQLWYGHRIALRTMDGEVVSKEEYPELHEKVEMLADEAGIPKPQVAVSSLGLPNAFAAGRSKETAIVCVTESLLYQLEDEELEAVLAHELTHIDNRDMVVMTVASTLGAIAFYAVRFGWSGGDKGNPHIWVAIVASLVVWIASFFATQALSRYREFAADAGAAELIDDPSAMQSALKSIDRTMARTANEDDMKQASEASAMMISAPKNGRKLTELVSSHPSTERRIEALEDLK